MNRSKDVADIIMLSDSERNRFAAWCRQQAESNEGIAEQLKRLGTHGEILADRQLVEATALTLVAEKLEHTEQVTVRADHTDAPGTAARGEEGSE
jgi:hypothetical protein